MHLMQVGVHSAKAEDPCIGSRNIKIKIGGGGLLTAVAIAMCASHPLRKPVAQKCWYLSGMAAGNW